SNMTPRNARMKKFRCQRENGNCSSRATSSADFASSTTIGPSPNNRSACPGQPSYEYFISAFRQKPLTRLGSRQSDPEAIGSSRRGTAWSAAGAKGPAFLCSMSYRNEDLANNHGWSAADVEPARLCTRTYLRVNILGRRHCLERSLSKPRSYF